MNEFKKSNKRQTHSIDGFVRSGPSQPNSLSSFNNYYSGNKKQAPQNNSDFKISKVDNFKSPDGFVPSTQAPINSPALGNAADIGVVNEAPEKAKKKLFQKTPKERTRGFMHFRKKSKDSKPHGKHRRFKIGLKTAGALSLVIILVAGGFGAKIYLKSRGILKGGGNGVGLNKNVDPTLLKGEGDGRVNIMLLGKGGPGHTAPDLTDTLLIASIDPIAKETALLSIPRDLWVKSAVGGQSKINAVYANAKYGVLNNYTTKQQTDEVKQTAESAGVKAIQNTLSSALGIPLHYYLMVDFEAFRQSIDSVGGIDINVTTELRDPSVAWENGNNPLIAGVGMQHFDGKRALLYARSRYSSSRGDFDRTERQRSIITALKTKVLNVGTFANPLKLNQLIDAFGDHVTTDFSLNEMMRVYEIAKDIDSAKIQSIGLADPPNDFVTTATVSNQSVVQPRAGLFDYTAIQSYIRNTLRDPYLKSENANITILNGTETPGLATLKSTELKSYGYNVALVADAPTTEYTKTTIIDLTKGVKKYTKNYLEKRLGVTAVTTLPDATIVPGTADFVIILGSNEPSAL